MALLVLALASAWILRRRSAYEEEKDVESAAKKKKMTQDELDAVIKFIR